MRTDARLRVRSRTARIAENDVDYTLDVRHDLNAAEVQHAAWHDGGA
jgi:hypothetical protein